MEWLTDLTTWLAEVLQAVLDAVASLFVFIIVLVIDAFSSAIAFALDAISLPAWFASNSLSALVQYLPSQSHYYIGALHLDNAIGVIVSAVLVRLVRKAVTLFQF